jgi:hypothetical protein
MTIRDTSALDAAYEEQFGKLLDCLMSGLALAEYCGLKAEDETAFKKATEEFESGYLLLQQARKIAETMMDDQPKENDK